MYKLRYVRSDGREILLTPENGIYVGTVGGATGRSTTISTAQGFEQLGETVQSLAVGGQQISVTGFIPRRDMQKKRDLLSIFTPQTRGRLIWEELFFVDVFVKDSPSVSNNIESRFVMSFFAPFPYWQRVTETVIKVGEITPSYRLPINFSTAHTFGSVEPASNFNLINSGDMPVKYHLTIRADTDDVENPKLTAQDGSYVEFVGTIEAGDKIELGYSELGEIEVRKTVDGAVSDALDMLSDLSTFFTLKTGDNPVHFSADSGEFDAVVTFVYNLAYAGVLMSDF